MRLFATQQELIDGTGSSRSIRVWDTTARPNRRMWACPSEAEVSERPGLILHRNRQGLVIGAIIVPHEEPATPTRYRSPAGKAGIDDRLTGCHVWALKNEANAWI